MEVKARGNNVIVIINRAKMLGKMLFCFTVLLRYNR